MSFTTSSEGINAAYGVGTCSVCPPQPLSLYKGNSSLAQKCKYFNKYRLPEAQKLGIYTFFQEERPRTLGRPRVPKNCWGPSRTPTSI